MDRETNHMKWHLGYTDYHQTQRCSLFSVKTYQGHFAHGLPGSYKWRACSVPGVGMCPGGSQMKVPTLKSSQ